MLFMSLLFYIYREITELVFVTSKLRVERLQMAPWRQLWASFKLSWSQFHYVPLGFCSAFAAELWAIADFRRVTKFGDDLERMDQMEAMAAGWIDVLRPPDYHVELKELSDWALLRVTCWDDFLYLSSIHD